MNPEKPHAENLRRGRFSQEGQAYLLTLVAKDRSPVFRDFTAARQAVRCFADNALHRCGRTLAFVVMPDHIHWLLELGAGACLSEAVRVYRARVSPALGHRIWQKGFHDRALRRDQDLAAVARYVVSNPVRSGIVQQVGDYPHRDAVWIQSRIAR